MSDRDRLTRRIAELSSIERGLQRNVSDYHQKKSRAQRDRADAGSHYDALSSVRSALSARFATRVVGPQSSEREISWCATRSWDRV